MKGSLVCCGLELEKKQTLKALVLDNRDSFVGLYFQHGYCGVENAVSAWLDTGMTFSL